MPQSEEIFERGLPASIDAERSILGAILLDNEVFFDGIADLSVNDFILESHQYIFSVMNDILFGFVEGCTHVDTVTLADELHRRKKASAVGGIAYIASLTEGLPRRLAVDEYVKTVRDKAKLRRLINIFSTAITRSADQSELASEITADIQDQLIEESADGDTSAVRIGDVVLEVEQRINDTRAMTDERTAVELTWGVSGLDAFTKGAFGGEMTVVSAESGGGKSSYAMQMTLANAQEGTPCAWLSLEMKREQVARRYYPAMSSILTADHIRDARLINLHTHVPEMQRISAELRKLPIWIDDTSSVRINKLIAKIRMMRRKHGIRLFVIDYLQLIEGKPGKQETSQVKEIIFALRDLVKSEPTIHLLVLSQYSKADGFVKKRKRTKGDLYGGSVIHHAAQNVILITIEDPEKKDRNDLLDVEFKIDKQRDGRTGKVTCMFDRDHLTYTYPQPPLTH